MKTVTFCLKDGTTFDLPISAEDLVKFSKALVAAHGREIGKADLVIACQLKRG